MEMRTTIKANNNNIKKIVDENIAKWGTNADLNHIDVSQVTNMTEIFNTSDFNGDISKWNVSNVKYMSLLFASSLFNGDISNWNVQNVINMYGMFNCSYFNGHISNWNVSNVIDMKWMFTFSDFSGDLTYWDIKSLEYISNMFKIENKDNLYITKLSEYSAWWYDLGILFTEFDKMKISIKEWKWINLDRKIIWRKRLNYALKDFGTTLNIPNKIKDFTIV